MACSATPHTTLLQQNMPKPYAITASEPDKARLFCKQHPAALASDDVQHIHLQGLLSCTTTALAAPTSSTAWH
jgi:hypothetical protein